ncbi:MULTISPECIES: OmpP1/FadL family transporter [Thioclava]|uniref:OmpP1/FadL family transporter n=1 Tax=Thioclava TaxID=285107 RepID=UPI000C490E9D|nr:MULTISPECIES: outer membrane protein transport protein [Thioclava]MAQ38366.1 hydrocarbon degradation protein [Thioclava sp.]|tara:strand:+ start:261 stop:1556 length:1296 start_codon:yes stop_codon:yes gene_type:complete
MKKFELPRFAGAVSLCLALGVPGVASATEGYFALAYGPAQRGVGGAGVAYSQDAMSGAINPAASAKIDRELSIGVELFAPFREYRSSGGSEFAFVPEGTHKSNNNIFLVPNVAYNMPLSNGGVLNFAFYGNGGMNSSYDDLTNNCPSGPPGAGSGVFCGGEAGVDLTQAFLSLGYAQQNGRLAWGVAPTLAVQRFSAKGLSYFRDAGLSADPANMTNRGYDYSWGLGLRAGLQYEVTPAVTLGISGQTKFRMSKFDKYSGLFENKGSFDIPASLAVGVAVKATPTLNLMLDYQRIFYSGVDSVANPTTATAQFGSKGGSGFGWDDVDVLRIGAEWQQSPDMTWRAGYAHATNPIGKEDVTFNILAPGVVEDHFSFGGTRKLNDRDRLDFSIAYVLPHSVSGPEMTPMGPTGNTIKLKMEQVSLSVGWSRKF